MVAAGVPGRIEYWKVNALAKRARRTTSRVCSKSSSVSPGKPTMMSVVMAASGMAARTLSMMPRYFSARYERRIAFSTASEPDCRGMCSWWHTFGVERLDLGEDLTGTAVLLLAPQRRDDAERARVVAAHRDGDPAGVGRL